MNTFFFWSGFIAWIFGGMLGLFTICDWIVDKVAESYNFKKMFLAFAWDRLKRRSDREKEQ